MLLYTRHHYQPCVLWLWWVGHLLGKTISVYTVWMNIQKCTKTPILSSPFPQSDSDSNCMKFRSIWVASVRSFMLRWHRVGQELFSLRAIKLQLRCCINNQENDLYSALLWGCQIASLWDFTTKTAITYRVSGAGNQRSVCESWSHCTWLRLVELVKPEEESICQACAGPGVFSCAASWLDVLWFET